MLHVIFFVTVGISLGWMMEAMFTPASKPETPGETRYLSLSEPPKSLEEIFAECRKENNVPVIGPGSSVVCVKRNAVTWEH